MESSCPPFPLLARVALTLVISLVFIRAMSAVLALPDISFVSFRALKALATWPALPGILQVLSLRPQTQFFESGQGGSDTAPLSMYTPSWRSFRAECIFRAVFFA
jgi:hypothetical protein